MTNKKSKNGVEQAIQELVKGQVIQLDPTNHFHPEENITTEQFIIWIVRSCTDAGQDECVSDYLKYAIEKGLIEDYDLVTSEKLIERRQVARIVHDTLRIELNEKDEDDWTAAKELADLYSCRTCVQHISQVYVKGIIEPEKPHLFNPTSNVTRAEAASVLVKMLDSTKRNPRLNEEKNSVTYLSPVQARELLSEHKTAVLLDVRSREAYNEGHLTGSRSLPLESIHQDSNQVSPTKDTPVVLYCQKGYRSRLAAEFLIEEGYTHIYTIPGVDDYVYDLI